MVLKIFLGLNAEFEHWWAVVPIDAKAAYRR
jgi:hypothetical protein